MKQEKYGEAVDAKKFEEVAASFSQTFSVFTAGSLSIGDGLLISNGVSQLNDLAEYINSMGVANASQEDEDQFLENNPSQQITETEGDGSGADGEAAGAVWDKPEDTAVAAVENGIVWNQIVNAQEIATDAYGIEGIPQIILFGHF